MSQLLEYLASFNRKERFFLLDAALGGLHLSARFRRRLGGAFGLYVRPDAFVAMDYHLDWLRAALALAAGEPEQGIHRICPDEITGTQEDIDLLLAFPNRRWIEVMLLEAKVETGWSNRQMESKARRLGRIFGRSGTRHPHVRPHFALISPRPPPSLRANGWPPWMTVAGRPLVIPLEVRNGLLRVERCDRSGRRDGKGRCWRAVRVHAGS